MSLSRQTGKKLVNSVGVYENVECMIKRSVDKENPTLLKSLPKNREKLDEAFQEVFIDFKAFKKDMGESDLNAKHDDESYMHEYNDQWFSSLRESYYDLVEASDVALENMADNV